MVPVPSRLRLSGLAQALAASMVFGSANVAAELKLLSESALGEVTAQAGLTIDLETKWTMAEFEYVDGGSMFWRDLSFSGINTDYVDNIRATVDVAGAGEVLHTGFSDIAELASRGVMDPTDPDVMWAKAQYDQGGGDFGKAYEDGDLVIHVTSQDFGLDRNDLSNWLVDPTDNLRKFKDAIDFHYQEREFGLRSSDKATETVWTRNFSMQAYLGYLDLVYKNRGNGFHDTAPLGTQPKAIKLGDSWMGFNVAFRVEDLDVENTNQSGNHWLNNSVTSSMLVIKDMRIHNERGADTEGSFGFATFESKTAAAREVLHTLDDMLASNMAKMKDNNGVAIYEINARMDWDLPHISFGRQNISIGEVYYTDLVVHNTSLVISAHE